MKTNPLLLIAALSALLSGCVTHGSAPNESFFEKVPVFDVEDWSHSGKYFAFTDGFTVQSISWSRDSDGSVTVRVSGYEGDATYAGSVGPHDKLRLVTMTFAPNSPQALKLQNRKLPPTQPSGK